MQFADAMRRVASTAASAARARARKAPVEQNEKARPRKRAAQPWQQPGQDADCPVRDERLAVSQQRRTQILLRFTVEGHEPEQRQVAPVVVVPVEQAVLLGAVRRVVGRVQIDGDAVGRQQKRDRATVDKGPICP